MEDKDSAPTVESQRATYGRTATMIIQETGLTPLQIAACVPVSFLLYAIVVLWAVVL